ncbi:hypothetical protein BB561_003886 [Smittium simulii]|uniref:Uncharacterized protein n=1 Tax=Smittium simulii TaxID=133385 RepID=A0A2T9YJ49_9FUNG|nr:hypothetical protein BB561_003886 [Smittium simulii]
MNEATLQRIEELTEKVNQLLLARETVPAPITGAQHAQDMKAQNTECKDTHEKARAPMVEEKKKEIIYECSKFLGMKYTPPQLNEAATSAVQKNNVNLY